MAGGSAARREPPGSELFEQPRTTAGHGGKGTSLIVRLMAAMGLSAPVFALLWVNARGGKSDAENRAVALVGERDQLAMKLATANSDADRVAAELVGLKKKVVLSDEHLLFEEAAEATRAERWPAAVELNRRFLEHFPGSGMVPSAHENLKGAIRAMAVIQDRARASEEAAALDNVSIAEIYADIKRYKGKTLVRDVDCRAITELMASSAKFESSCEVGQEDVRVLYTSSKDVKLLAALPRGLVGRFEYSGVFKIVGREPYGDGVVLRFLSLAE
jgi:hypothetical protein